MPAVIIEWQYKAVPPNHVILTIKARVDAQWVTFISLFDHET